MGYDYDGLCQDAEKLCETFPFIELFSIGESVMEKQLYCFKLGSGEKKLFINGAHHGLEYLTSAFIMRFLRDFCICTQNHCPFHGYDTTELLHNTTLYAVPMVNPDGVDIAVNGIDITNPHHRELISNVGIHSFHKVWQANVRGVDINHNYNAGWRVVVEHPSPSQYAGPCCESEPETRAIVNFVRNINCDMLIAFHSQGGEIYYDFDGMVNAHSQELAAKFAQSSGYSVTVPTGSAAFGGCKDWFIDEFGRAGFTVEIGHGTNPLPVEMLDNIYDENAKLVLCAMSEV